MTGSVKLLSGRSPNTSWYYADFRAKNLIEIVFGFWTRFVSIRRLDRTTRPVQDTGETKFDRNFVEILPPFHPTTGVFSAKKHRKNKTKKKKEKNHNLGGRDGTVGGANDFPRPTGERYSPVTSRAKICRGRITTFNCTRAAAPVCSRD